MNTSRSFSFLLTALPFIEIYLLIRLIGVIGFLPTVGWLLLTATLGMMLIRHQGLSALTRAQQALARGELPAREVIDSGIAVLGGVLLVIPGLLSDLFALVCLIPWSRQRLAERLMNSQFSIPGSARRASEDSIIEGEFRRED